MAEPTPLDQAFVVARSAADETEQMTFYQQLVATELFVLLEGESDNEIITPSLFEVDGQSFVLAFDTEARLSGFTGGASHYAAMSGRSLVGLLAPEGLGLGVNLGVPSSETLLPSDLVGWLHETLARGPAEVETQVREFHPPGVLPERLLTGLDARLASASGLAENAYLAGVVYENGANGHMLGVIDVLPGAEAALAQAVSEVLQFSGLEAAAIDVGFFRAEDPVSASLAKVGLRFDLPKPAPVERQDLPAPGMDPDRPPKLN